MRADVRADTALGAQIAGNHYKGAIQPIQFIHANDISYCEANVIKYIYRHAKKNGVEDVKKAIHYALLLLEMQYGLTIDAGKIIEAIDNARRNSGDRNSRGLPVVGEWVAPAQPVGYVLPVRAASDSIGPSR